MAMAYGGKHQPMEFVLLGDNIAPSSRLGHAPYAPACILGSPAQRVVYVGPNQSMRRGERRSEWLAWRSDRGSRLPPSQISPQSSNSRTPSAVIATLFGGSPAPT